MSESQPTKRPTKSEETEKEKEKEKERETNSETVDSKKMVDEGEENGEEEEEDEEEEEEEDGELDDNDYDLNDKFIVESKEEHESIFSRNAQNKFKRIFAGDDHFIDEDPALRRPKKKLKLLQDLEDESKPVDDKSSLGGFIVGKTDDDKYRHVLDEEEERLTKTRGLEMLGDDAYDDYDDGDDEEEGEDDNGEKKELDEAEKLERLKKMFGEDELEKRFLTKEDAEIVKRDVPERLQLRRGFDFREKMISSYTTDEKVKKIEKMLEEESKWVYKLMFPANDYKKEIVLKKKRIHCNDEEDDDDDDDWTKGVGEGYKNNNNQMKDEGLITFNKGERNKLATIQFILYKIVVEKFEVPYIWTYKRDLFQSAFEEEELWKIFDLDEEYAVFMERKTELKEMFKGVGTSKVNKNYAEMLEETSGLQQLNDFYEFYRHFYPAKKGSSTEKTFAKRKRKSLYLAAKNKTELKALLKLFGLSSHEYAENLQQGYSINTVNDAMYAPLQTAKEYVCREFPSPKVVLKAARLLFARNIAAEPSIKERVRDLYDCFGKLSVSVTDKGRLISDEHFLAIKNWKGVPLYYFDNVEEDDAEEKKKWENVFTAFQSEKDGLVTLKFDEIDHEFWKNCLNYENYYYSDKVSSIAKKWNEQRKKVIEQAIGEFHSIMQKFIRSKYLRKAKLVVGKLIEEEMTDYLMEGPYKAKSSDILGDEELVEDKVGKHRIISCVPARNKKEDTVFVMLDSNGVPIDSMKWMYTDDFVPDDTVISYFPTMDVKLQENKLIAFVKKYNPDVVILSANTLSCKRTMSHVEFCLREPQVIALYVTDELGRIYARSERSTREFPHRLERTKIAISNGRRFNDPLLEYARLVDRSDSILSLKLHRLQKSFTRDEIMKWIVRAFVRMTNSCGVDLNRIVMYKNMGTSLQFICGMGIRKSINLLQRCPELVEKRTEMLDSDWAFLGAVVYKNAIGFMTIQSPRVDLREENEFFRLDRTRIHVDDYMYARKMCTDALDAPTPGEEEYDQHEKYIEEIMENPLVLEELDLEAYAMQLEEKDNTRKKSILLMCKNELTKPFKDIRTTREELTENDVFYAMINETRESFKIGAIVNATVVHLTLSSVTVKLENGLIGTVRAENVSDEEYSKIPDILQTGATVEGKIIVINRENVEKIEVELDLKQSSITEIRDRGMDLAFVENSRKKKKKKKKKTRRQQVTRKVEHKNFQNFDYEEAQKHLKDKPLGEFVVRPSFSKGTNTLCLTFKFIEDININLTIEEEEKRKASLLGKVLVYKNVEYESIDELGDGIVKRICYYGRKVTSYSRFVKHSPKVKKRVVNILKNLKRKNKKLIPYRIITNKKKPLAFYIYYLPERHIIKESFKVGPKGYQLNADHRKFKSIDDLIARFKTRYKTLPSYLQMKKRLEQERELAELDRDEKKEAERKKRRGEE